MQSIKTHSETGKRPLYRVIAGSFKNKEDAQDRASFLEQQQIDAFLDKTDISGEAYYRVQAGAFRNWENAMQRLRELKKMGLGEAFMSTDSTPVAHSPPQTDILGDIHLNAEDLDEYARSLNPDAPRLGQYYVNFGRHYGVRGDIAFAQALFETHDFHFKGPVNPEQNNYCNLGTLSPKRPGESFPTPQSGVLAHIQHLYACASTEPLPEGYPLVDPHFKQVHRGSAKTWTVLTPTTPSNRYGEAILQKYDQMADYIMEQTPSADFSWRHLVKKIWRKMMGK